jgi:hypothetical protein
MSDLPQGPQRGDTLDLEIEGDATTLGVELLLHDDKMDVWTARDEASGDLMLIRLGDDLTWHHISVEIL